MGRQILHYFVIIQEEATVEGNDNSEVSAQITWITAEL